MSRNTKRKQDETAAAGISGNSSSSDSPEAKKPTGPIPTPIHKEERKSVSNPEIMAPPPCKGCQIKDKVIKELEESIEAKNTVIENLNTKNETLNKQIVEHMQVIAHLKAQLADTPPSTSTDPTGAGHLPDIATLVQKTVVDVLERQNCAKCLVVSGLPERAQPGQNPAADGEDLETAKTIVSICGGDPSAVQDVYRMGEVISQQDAQRFRVKPKPSRLLKIELSSTHVRSIVVKNAKNLRNNTDFKDIYVNPSRPKEDRIKIAKLHQELARRRAEGERLYLSYYDLMIKTDTRPPRNPIPQDVQMHNP